MNLNQRLIKALSPLGLPAAPDVDVKHRNRTFTFNYDLLPDQFADGRPLYWRALVQVHLFLPLEEDSVALRGMIPGILAGAGFTWPEVVDATDGQSQHYVFETETIMKVEV